jgi:hypothetical protein
MHDARFRLCQNGPGFYPRQAAMPRRKPSQPASSNLRRTIASHAARLMAEDGVDNYGLAKRKAARALGASESESLPTNEEIETELRAYQSLYQEDEHPQRLRELRETALEIMELLDEFHPYLTGSVLDGTAGRFAEIEIDLFSDSGKDVEIFLLSHDIFYQIAEFSRKGPDAPELRLRLQSGETPVVLSVFQLLAERQLRRSPHTGKGHARAKTSTVVDLLSS